MPRFSTGKLSAAAQTARSCESSGVTDVNGYRASPVRLKQASNSSTVQGGGDNRNNARTENDSSNPWGWIKVKRPRPDVEALEAKRVMTNSLSLTPTIPFSALNSIILWDNAIMRQASAQGGGKRRGHP